MSERVEMPTQYRSTKWLYKFSIIGVILGYVLLIYGYYKHYLSLNMFIPVSVAAVLYTSALVLLLKPIYRKKDLLKINLSKFVYLLSKDHVQASEKLWGAAALMVKAVAASRGISISSHGELFSFVRRLGEEERNPELRRLFSVASTLHQNFYENWLRGDVVREYSEDVKQLVAELKKLIRTPNCQKRS